MHRMVKTTTDFSCFCVWFSIGLKTTKTLSIVKAAIVKADTVALAYASINRITKISIPWHWQSISICCIPVMSMNVNQSESNWIKVNQSELRFENELDGFGWLKVNFMVHQMLSVNQSVTKFIKVGPRFWVSAFS